MSGSEDTPPPPLHVDALEATDADSLLNAFLAYCERLGIRLYDAQEEAILEIFSGQSVILNTPTGSGKSLVATAMCFKALAEGKRVFYTAPIKALVNEKFFSACRTFGATHVGMMTGDASINHEASIICCTAEILANIALRNQAEAEADYVVMDEFHYYSDRDRGWAWQVPLLILKRARFLLMSATLGDVNPFTDALEALTGEPPSLVRSDERPVPLDFTYQETPLHETIQELYEEGKAPIYIVHFTQRATVEQAQALMSIDFLTKAQKYEIRQALGNFRFDSPFGKDLGRFIRHGLGVHHAGLLPKYRLLVERLAQQGLLKIICGTDTLGVGVNVPIRTVLFTRLCKYDGKKTGILRVRDFKQIAGRAGRKGFDDEGFVVCQAPEHVIENITLRRKAEGDAKKMRKLKLRKAPERGYAHWDEKTFRRLIESDSEQLKSSFGISHGMLLEVLDRPDGNGCQAMKSMIRRCHEPRARKYALGRHAIAIFRSLVQAKVIELKKVDAQAHVKVNSELQEDFSLNHSLSLFTVKAIEGLDPEDEHYAFDVITLVEATLEDPTVVLIKQLDKKKTELIASLKAEGVEYEERMAELEKVDIDKPRLEFILETMEAFKLEHPWVDAHHLAPKSIVRELFEKAMGFREYVKEYGLSRAEGVFLRYLSSAYKTLVQNVPENAKNDLLYDLTDELGAMIREVDSSLIDEWERMQHPDKTIVDKTEAPEPEEKDITRDRRAFTAMVRNAHYRLLRALALKRFDDAMELFVSPEGRRWNRTDLGDRINTFLSEFDAIRFDPDARNPKNTQIEIHSDHWKVHQILVDPDGFNEWAIQTRIDLGRARAEDRPVLELLNIGPITAT